jgi:hypothetical protein
MTLIKKLLIQFTNSLYPTVSYSIFRVAVSGLSMFPELIPGKTYWASSFFRPRAGKRVVFEHRGEYIVKKISRIEKNVVYLTGTTVWSSLYTIPSSAVRGIVYDR